VKAVGSKQDLLFCEQKRSKKNFALRALATPVATPPRTESFLLLFFKKEALAFL
jgi:hypothetical protein